MIQVQPGLPEILCPFSYCPRALQGASMPQLSHMLFASQLLSKYDPQKEAELRSWIEGLTGLSIGPDFQKGLKDGVILCT